MTINIIDKLQIQGLKSLYLQCEDNRFFSFGSHFDYSYPVSFDQSNIGIISCNVKGEGAVLLSDYMAPIIYLEKDSGLGDLGIKILNWVYGAKKLAPEVCDWIGIYYKANYFLKKDTTDLYLGPFIGEPTDHKIIPLTEGLCGLALREERVVNVKDVNNDDRHIACSLKTKSELIIPLKNHNNEMVAELDIDCNSLGAFTSEIEELFTEYSKSFANLLS